MYRDIPIDPLCGYTVLIYRDIPIDPLCGYTVLIYSDIPMEEGISPHCSLTSFI